MKEILIDTDIFIDFLRNNKKTKKIFEQILSEQLIGFCSVITEAEILSGKECELPHKRDLANNLLSLVSKIDVNIEIAIQSGEFRRKYQIPLLDSIIAATAFKLKVPLYTRNQKDFASIKEIKIEVPY